MRISASRSATMIRAGTIISPYSKVFFSAFATYGSSEELTVVLEPDRLRRVEAGDLRDAVVRERVVRAEDHRPERQRQEAEDPREDEEIRDPGLTVAETGRPAPGPRGARRCRARNSDAGHASLLVRVDRVLCFLLRLCERGLDALLAREDPLHRGVVRIGELRAGRGRRELEAVLRRVHEVLDRGVEVGLAERLVDVLVHLLVGRVLAV